MDTTELLGGFEQVSYILDVFERWLYHNQNFWFIFIKY